MSDLEQIVNLGSARDMGFANTGAVDAGICLNLHIIFNHRRPGLDNFVPAAGVILGKAKTIAANDYAILQNDVITNAAVLSHNGVRMSKEVIANARATIDHDVCQQYCVLADANIFVHYCIGADVRAFADFGGRVDHSVGMHSRRVLWWLIKQLDCLRERQVRILASEHWGWADSEV